MKKNQNIENQINEMKYRFGYVLSESPRYRSVVSDDENFDNVPAQLFQEADEELPPEAGGVPMPPDPNSVPPDATTAPVEPPTDGAGATPPDMGNIEMNAPPTDMPMSPDMGMPVEPPAPEVDEIQNEIIKHNTAAMQAINAQLESMSSFVDSLNMKIDRMNADVEEVREPTNVEKLMNKSQVSYPYYFNLNDIWGDNWFSQKREEENEKGVRELDDGTFIADFDDLPSQSTSNNISDTFNDLI